MAIKHKRKTTTGYTWLTTDLVDGQLGLNTTDGTLHIRNAGGTSVHKIDNTATVKSVAQGGTGLSALGTGLQVLRTNAGATAMEWSTPTASSPALNPLGPLVIEEDFLTGGVGVGTATNSLFGKFMGYKSVSNVNVIDFKVGEANHPGIVQIQRCVNGGEYNCLLLNNNTGSITASEISTFIAIVRPLNSSNNNLRIGFMDTWTSGTPSHGIFFSSQGGGGWQAVTRLSNVQTLSATISTITYGNWYVLKIVKNGTNYDFSVNGGAATTISTNKPTTQILTPGCANYDSGTNGNHLDVDYIGLQTNAYTQRYT